MYKMLAVPSLYFLLCACGANLAVNGFYFNDAVFMGAGCAVFAAAQILFFCVIKKFGVRKGSAPVAFAFMVAVAVSQALLAAKPFAAQPLALPEVFEAVALKVTSGRYSNKVLLAAKVKGREEDFLVQGYALPPLNVSEGDELIVAATPRSIDATDTNRFTRQLIRTGIRGTVTLHEQNCFVKTVGNPGIISKIRTGAEGVFTSALMRGLYFNDRSRISKRTLADFKRSGVMHVLAASGLHVGIVTMVPLAVSALLLLPKIGGLCVGFVLVVGYLFIAGIPVSLLRAGAMLGLFVVQRLLLNERNPYNVLFWAGIAILTIFPEELYGLGFQLSFGATAALLVFMKQIRPAFYFLPGWLGDSVAVTFSVHIISAPVILLALGEINYTGLLGNLIVVPAITLFMPLSLLSFFTAAFWPAAGGALGGVCDKLYAGIEFAVRLLADIPGHFKVSGIAAACLLVCPMAMAVISLVPFKYSGKLKAGLLTCAMFAGCGALSIAAFIAKPAGAETFCVQAAGAECFILCEKGKAVVAGELASQEQTEEVLDILDKHTARSVSLYITKPDFNNVRFFTRIVKQACVDECHIDEGLRLSKYLRNFFLLLQQEKVKLVFGDIKGMERGLFERAKGEIPQEEKY